MDYNFSLLHTITHVKYNLTNDILEAVGGLVQFLTQCYNITGRYITMDDNLKKIFEKWDEFKDTHVKMFLPERRKAILDLYDRLRLELRDEATFTLDDQQTCFTITVTAYSFIASDNAPALRAMIQNANVFRADIKDGRIVFDMWFMCWDWVAKT